MQRALVLSLLLCACMDGVAGPVGPGGAASSFGVRAEGGDVDFSRVVPALQVLTASVTTLVMTGELPATSIEAPAEALRLELDLDIRRIEEGPFPIDLSLDIETTSSTTAVLSNVASPSSTVVAARWLRVCAACPSSGSRVVTQGLSGSLRIPLVDALRLEARAELETMGPFLTEPDRSRAFTLTVFWDVAR